MEDEKSAFQYRCAGGHRDHHPDYMAHTKSNKDFIQLSKKSILNRVEGKHMDLSKIFVKDANPTKMGGQAVMEGIMMKGDKKTAVAVRLPSGDIHIKTEENPKKRTWAKIPIVRGVIVFVNSLIQGTKTLMYSADVLEKYEEKLGEGALKKRADLKHGLKNTSEKEQYGIYL